jgi:hypothetical protein
MLKLDARAKLVASGIRIDRSWRRFLKPVNQSSPASSFSNQDLGMFVLFK